MGSYPKVLRKIALRSFQNHFAQMGQTNHVQIGLVVLALIGLGLAYPAEQINSDELSEQNDPMDLFGPYLDYIASLRDSNYQDAPSKRMLPYIVHKRMPYIVHKRMPYIVHKRMPYILHKRMLGTTD